MSLPAPSAGDGDTPDSSPAATPPPSAAASPTGEGGGGGGGGGGRRRRRKTRVSVVVHAKSTSAPHSLFQKISASSVLDSPMAKSVADSSVRLMAAHAGSLRNRRRSSAHGASSPNLDSEDSGESPQRTSSNGAAALAAEAPSPDGQSSPPSRRRMSTPSPSPPPPPPPPPPPLLVTNLQPAPPPAADHRGGDGGGGGDDDDDADTLRPLPHHHAPSASAGSVHSAAGSDTSHRSNHSRVASSLFWEGGMAAMPEDVQDVDAVTRRRAISLDLLEVELQQKDQELKMAAEIGLQLFEKSEAAAARVEELQLNVRSLQQSLQELEMENEVMQRKMLSMRRRQETMSRENIKLTSEAGKIDVLRDELADAQENIERLEGEVARSRASSRRGSMQQDGASSRRPSLTFRSRRYSGSRRGSGGGTRGGGDDDGDDRDGGRRSGNYSEGEGSDADEDGEVGADADTVVLTRDEVKQMEELCEGLEREVQASKEKVVSAEAAVVAERHRLHEANVKVVELEHDIEHLRIEAGVSKRAADEARTSTAELTAQLNEDKDIITMLRSRVTTLEDELAEIDRMGGVRGGVSPMSLATGGGGGGGGGSRPRFDSRLDGVAHVAVVAGARSRVESRADFALANPETGKRYSMDSADGSVQHSRNNTAESVLSSAAEVMSRRPSTTLPAAAAAPAAASAPQQKTHDDDEDDLQDRLVAKLQESTTNLMQAQTDLNSYENKLQEYKRQMAEWHKETRPEFTVRAKPVDPAVGHVEYTITLVQNGEKCHTLDQRYSAFDKFRARLKRKLFVSNHASQLRLPALPPKVWGHARSSSAHVVAQREEGFTLFLKIMLALAEIDHSIGAEFFDWIGWHMPDRRVAEEEEEQREAEDKVATMGSGSKTESS